MRGDAHAADITFVALDNSRDCPDYVVTVDGHPGRTFAHPLEHPIRTGRCSSICVGCVERLVLRESRLQHSGNRGPITFERPPHPDFAHPAPSSRTARFLKVRLIVSMVPSSAARSDA